MTFCLKGDCVRGVGRQITLKGRVYAGSFRQGKPEGEGEMTWPDGRCFKGNFTGGKPQGKGVMATPMGRYMKVVMEEGRVLRYQVLPGDRRIEGARYGTFSSDLGEYRGWFRGNRLKGYRPHGRGRMRFASGSTYIGQWKKGIIHGNGKMTWKNGARYVGQWKEGVRSGFGTYHWPGGSAYQGGWEDNRRSGPGIYQSAEGKVHIGYWQGERCYSTPNRGGERE
jgi:hypothetical protein